jgi:hypothetical protein
MAKVELSDIVGSSSWDTSSSGHSIAYESTDLCDTYEKCIGELENKIHEHEARL